MSLLSSSDYKDLHAEMRESLSPVTLERVNDYLEEFNKQLDNNAKDLYKQRYLRCLRMATDGKVGSIFISSVAWAEMRKSTTCKVDLGLARHGIVQQTQCECGACEGPSSHTL